MNTTINKIIDQLKGIARSDMTIAELKICNILVEDSIAVWQNEDEKNYICLKPDTDEVAAYAAECDLVDDELFEITDF